MAGHGSSPAKRARSSSSIAKMLSNTEVSVQLLEVLAENSYDSILMTDAGEGNITYANKAFTLLTGHGANDVIGKSPKILQGEATDKKVISRLAQALKSGGDFEGKAINFKEDGTPFIMYWRVVPVKVGGEIKAWVAIQREEGPSPVKPAFSSSSLAKMLSNTEVSVQLLEVLAENSFESILMTDAGEGNITYTNKAFTLLTGHEAADVIGKSPKILQGEGTDKKVISRLTEALKSGGDFDGKAINFKKDGTPFIMCWRVVPVKVGGEIKAWVAIQRQGSHV